MIDAPSSHGFDGPKFVAGMHHQEGGLSARHLEIHTPNKLLFVSFVLFKKKRRIQRMIVSLFDLSTNRSLALDRSRIVGMILSSRFPGGNWFP